MIQDASDIPYPEWRDDVTTTFGLQVQAKASKGDFLALFREQFRQKYPDQTTRSYRQNRVEAALRWLESHLDEIEAEWPDDTVGGGGEALVSNRLILALYGMYCRCPDKHLHDDFPVSILHRFLETK